MNSAAFLLSFLRALTSNINYVIIFLLHPRFIYILIFWKVSWFIWYCRWRRLNKRCFICNSKPWFEQKTCVSSQGNSIVFENLFINKTFLRICLYDIIRLLTNLLWFYLLCCEKVLSNFKVNSKWFYLIVLC